MGGHGLSGRGFEQGVFLKLVSIRWWEHTKRLLRSAELQIHPLHPRLP